MGPSSHLSVNHINVTREGVSKFLADLDPHKASGTHQLLARLLKKFASELALVYALFFQVADMKQDTTLCLLVITDTDT